ncbi:MAG: hypothetical protein V1725_00820 [archaeon]
MEDTDFVKLALNGDIYRGRRLEVILYENALPELERSPTPDLPGQEWKEGLGERPGVCITGYVALVEIPQKRIYLSSTNLMKSHDWCIDMNKVHSLYAVNRGIEIK